MKHRPNPSKLLEYVQSEERRHSHGKLKIFLGAAPGVGKTYAMLSEAVVRKEEGVDVVAGIVETHGRKETERFLGELEILPRHKIEYRGKTLEEFDLDAALKRKPDLILIDEMAHNNAPGSRHTKRWQDIVELLEQGIHVYTTVNVQHLESLNNIITQITGILVRETIPDTMFAKADSIELIDLPADDLIQRLEEGKVYVPSDVDVAIEHYFRKSNLTALRDLALRQTEEIVDAEVLLSRRGESTEKIWPTKERLLVCVGSDPASAHLVRAGFRMAKSFKANWMVISVETLGEHLSEDEHQTIIHHLRLAETLGAETLVISGIDIVDEIINFAKDRNITKIIIGKHVRTRWQDLFSPSLADKLLRKATDIGIFILSAKRRRMKKKAKTKAPTPFNIYLLSLAVVSVCTLINYIFSNYLQPAALIMVYLFGALPIALLGYWGPSLLFSAASVVLYDFFFVSPHFELSIPGGESFITLVFMFFVSVIISNLTMKAKLQAKFARLREQRIAVMHSLSKALATSRGIDTLLEVALRHISDVFNSDVFALLPDKSHKLIAVIGMAEKGTLLTLNEKDQSVAQWVFESGKPAGLGTDTLPDNAASFVPLLGKKAAVGVLKVTPKTPSVLLVPEQMHLLEALANQVGMALEIERLQGESQKKEVQIETDRMRNLLLKYLAANMHPPLLDIMNSAKELILIGHEVNSESIQGLGNRIFYNSEELNHLVNNISQIARLESSDIAFTKELHSLYDVAMDAIKGLARHLDSRLIKMKIPENFPMVPFNKVFLEQVIFNILENAIKYTPPGTYIEISAALEPGKVIVSIEDEGPGLSFEEINKIFEKFYRGQRITSIKGLGLGLAICQKIISMHGGEIWAENRKEGGAAFRFTLPLE